MAKRKWKIGPERLQSLLGPHRFRLESFDEYGYRLAFSRPSHIERLYDQLHITGQGKSGEAVYAVTTVAGIRTPTIDPCIATEDMSLLFALQADDERHWTIIESLREAEAWELKLAGVADTYCRQTASRFGPALQSQLLPLFDVLEKYLQKLGDINSILDSEWKFIDQAPAEEIREADRLVLGFGGGYGRCVEDAQLAAHIMARFGRDVENADALCGKKVNEDDQLRAKLHLLTDFIRECRKRYVMLQRPSFSD